MDVKDFEKIKGALTEVKGGLIEKIEEQKADLQKHKETTTETAAKLKGLEERYEQLIADLKGGLEELQKKNERLAQEASQAPREFKSPGQIYVESQEYKDYASEGFSGLSKRSMIPSSFSMQANMALKGVTGDSELRNVLSTERLMEIIRNPVRQARVRDLFPVIPTTVGAVEYVRETLSSTVNTSATTVAEAAPKPEAVFDFEDVNVPMRTIAHWVPVNNQLLADVNALRAFIDTRLIEGLKLREDVQLLYGSGVNPDLNGILTDADIQTYLWSRGAVTDTRLDAIRRGITLARVAEFPVDAIIIHPSDWEKIELLKGTDAHYVWVSVTEGGQPRVWRVPVIDTTAINAGDCLVGAFGMGAAIWDREEANIAVSDSHSDFFIKNRTAIRAEERLALAIYRPQAFTHVQFNAAPTS